ncbi:drug resistance MFS transporter, drug:H+ antiporter-2 (14 Spanner) (DHA2) family [compost metagenome]
MQLASHPEMGHWRLSLFGLTLGLVTGIDFSSTLMMGVASQHIQGGVGAAPEDYLYAVSAYAATAVLMNMVLDQVARRVTYKRFTLASLVVFILGSLICAEFASPAGLISGKAVQGLGAGGLFAASRILVQLVSTPAERGALMLRFGGGAFSMLAIAPWLTSIFLDDIGWRAVFLFQAGIALPVLLSVALTYPTRAPRDPHPPVSTLDWPAAIAAAAGALVFLHTLQEMRYTRFFSSLEMPLAALGGVALFAFAGWRLYRHPDPWIDLSRLAGRQYLYGLGFYTLYYLMSSAWAFLLPSLTQTGLGLTFRTTCMLLATSGTVATIGAVVITLGMALVFRKRRRSRISRTPTSSRTCASRLPRPWAPGWPACSCRTGWPSTAPTWSNKSRASTRRCKPPMRCRPRGWRRSRWKSTGRPRCWPAWTCCTASR